MNQYSVSKPQMMEDGFKCIACGHVWKTTDIKDSCPVCGYACNAYVCSKVLAKEKD